MRTMKKRDDRGFILLVVLTIAVVIFIMVTSVIKINFQLTKQNKQLAEHLQSRADEGG